ncbi:MAG: DUF4251 domain-containing protein [Muribaculaceae bacterium]|nr:DUF4251 domain-containing protein [Muribaculaceae bacterium]
MKKILLTLSAIMMMGVCAQAQSIPDEVEIVTDENVELEIITPAEPVQETEQDIKEREKRLRELNDDLGYAKAVNSLRRGYFVLVADNVQIGSMGYRHYDINGVSNFVLVQDQDGIIQFALNTGNPGVNGLGGWTGKGRVRDMRVNYADNGDVFVQYHLISGQVSALVSITLFHNTKRAVARVTGGTEITMYGEILPYRDKKHR